MRASREAQERYQRQSPEASALLEQDAVEASLSATKRALQTVEAAW